MKKHLFFILLLFLSLGMVRGQEITVTIKGEIFLNEFDAFSYTVDGITTEVEYDKDKPIVDYTVRVNPKTPIIIEITKYSKAKKIINRFIGRDFTATELCINKWKIVPTANCNLTISTIEPLTLNLATVKGGVVELKNDFNEVITSTSIIKPGSKMYITPKPNIGYEYIGLKVAGQTDKNPDETYFVTPTFGVLEVTPIFKEVLGFISVPKEALNTCDISWIVNGVEQSVTPQDTVYKAPPGTVVKTKIVPIEGYKLDILRLDGKTVILDQDNCYEVTIAANKDLKWFIDVIKVTLHTVKYSSSGNGNIELYNLSGELINSGINVEDGAGLELKVVPDINYVFSLEATKKMSNVDIVESNNRFYIKADKPVSIIAQFDKLPALVNLKDLSTIDLSKVENLSLSGVWNTSDFSILTSKINKSSLKTVVLADGFATLQNTKLNSVFAGCVSLKDVDLRGLGNVKTSGLFTGCIALRYIKISNGITLDSNQACLTGTSANLLIYGEANSSNPWERGVYIAGTQAGDINLVHGEPFECPIGFNASSISYTREFTKTSGAGKGYEAIVLPFSPQSFTTVEENARVLKPWASYDSNSDTDVPFWLCRVTPANEDYTDATLAANTPYLISFPNDLLQYGEAFSVSGNVKFSAINAQVVSTLKVQNTGQAFKLTNNYENINSGQDFYAMSLDGSFFENLSFRTIVPFEAYASSLDGVSKAPKLYIGRAPTGIDEVLKNKNNSSKFNVFARGNVIVIDSEIESNVNIYNATGIVVRNVRVEIGENVVSDLAKGIYIVSGKKVIL